jgi:hypothetical protein
MTPLRGSSIGQMPSCGRFRAHANEKSKNVFFSAYASPLTHARACRPCHISFHMRDALHMRHQSTDSQITPETTSRHTFESQRPVEGCAHSMHRSDSEPHNAKWAASLRATARTRTHPHRNPLSRVGICICICIRSLLTAASLYTIAQYAPVCLARHSLHGPLCPRHGAAARIGISRRSKQNRKSTTSSGGGAGPRPPTRPSVRGCAERQAASIGSARRSSASLFRSAEHGGRPTHRRA